MARTLTNAENVSRHRIAKKRKAVEYKGGKCSICGYHRNISALQFHHVIPSEKVGNISGNFLCLKWDTVKEELDKCILVCANCHAELENPHFTLV